MALITGISPAICFLIVFLIIIASASIKILKEYERGVIFRLGRLIGAKGPGKPKGCTVLGGGKDSSKK